MVDLKRILKKHFKYTRNNRNILSQFNNKKFNYLYSLTNIKRDLTPEEILLILSLQGEERSVGFEKESTLFFNFPKDFLFHYESALTERLILTNENFKIEINRNSTFSPETIEKESLQLIKFQSYCFKINSKRIDYKSENFYPFSDDSSKVQYTSNDYDNFNLNLTDNKGNTFNLKKGKERYSLNLIINNKNYFIIFVNDCLTKKEVPGLFNKYNNLKPKSYTFKANRIDSNFVKENLFFTHEWKIHNTTMVEKMINNFSDASIEPVQNEKEKIQQKLNSLYHPLNRPSVDVFLKHKLKIKSIIPSIIYLIYLIVILISFIVCLIIFIKHLITS